MQVMEEREQLTSSGLSATELNPHGWAESSKGAFGYWDGFVRSPTFKKGEALQFVPGLMDVGRPYPFQFLDWWFVVVKRADGALDFLYVDRDAE